MQIRNLKLLNFRNYEKLEISFSDNFNLIYGKNGMGKTNLVESIYVLALTKSFRGSSEKVLIHTDSGITRIEGTINNNAEANYKIIITDSGKKVKINNNQIEKLSEYVSKIAVVLFNPDDLRIIKDTPSIRRRALNVEISQLNNVYLKYLNQYNKILKQRNSYLKTMYLNMNSSKEYLDVLTEKLVDVGEKIYKMRAEFVEKINNYISSTYKKIALKGLLEIKYISDYSNFDKQKILNEYKNSISRDLMLGKTQMGIQHDDLKFTLDGNNLKDYGSEGQQKNAIIAFKISEIEIFKQEKNILPIFILDDLFSELDKEKIFNILDIIDGNIQTFITTTDISNVGDKIKSKSKIFEVIDGNVREENAK